MALSALYLLVPDAESLLNDVRGLPGVGLLEPAHVSLGYPWLEPPLPLDLVRSVAAANAPLAVTFTGPFRFEPDVRGRTVVHLRPSSDEPFHELARALGGTLRTPHLSVARVGRSGDVDAVETALAPLLPLRTTLTEVEVTVRNAPGEWSTALLAPLSGSPERASTS